MLRKVISIICYIIAGFFVYVVNFLAFVNLSFPLWVKFAIMGVFCIPGVVALVIGLAINRFRYWKRDVGIVFVSGAGATAFIVFSMACFFLSPEFKKLFPDKKLAFFSDIDFERNCITTTSRKTKKSMASRPVSVEIMSVPSKYVGSMNARQEKIFSTKFNHRIKDGSIRLLWFDVVNVASGSVVPHNI